MSSSKWDSFGRWTDNITDKLCLPCLGPDIRSKPRTFIITRDSETDDSSHLGLTYKWAVIYGLGYIIAIFVSLALLTTSVVVDDIHSIKGGSMTFEGLSGQSKPLTIDIPASHGGYQTLRYNSPEDGDICPQHGKEGRPMIARYSTLAQCESDGQRCATERKSDSVSGIALSLSELGLAQIQTNSGLGVETLTDFSAVSFLNRVLEISSLTCHAVAFTMLIAMRRPPRSLLLHRSKNTDFISFVMDYGPHWLIMLGGVLLFLSTALATSFRHDLTSHIAAYAIACRTSPGDPIRAAFNPGNSNPSNLDAMLVFAEYVHKSGGAGVSILLSTMVVYIDLFASIMVIWVGTRGAYHKDRAKLTDAQLDRLPFHAKIWHIVISLVFLAFSLASTWIAGYWTRVRGFPLNERFWSIDRPLGRADLDDIVLNHLAITYASYEVADFATGIWALVGFLLWLVTPDKTRFLSKYAQLLGFAYFLRALIVPWTVLPVPTSITQIPMCYKKPEGALFGDIITAVYCNDMMYSGHAAFISLPCLIAIAFVVYGPVRRKILATCVL
ncbi:hypothetical protein FOZ62_030801, partial [Perkinsus olseni]